jgi:hypothetical protein
MSIKIRRTSVFQLLVTAFTFFGASISLFAAASSLSRSGIEIAGVDFAGQSAFSIAAAVLCVVGSVCLGVGSVRLDMRIRASKASAVALAQDRA